MKKAKKVLAVILSALIVATTVPISAVTVFADSAEDYLAEVVALKDAEATDIDTTETETGYTTTVTLNGVVAVTYTATDEEAGEEGGYYLEYNVVASGKLSYDVLEKATFIADGEEEATAISLEQDDETGEYYYTIRVAVDEEVLNEAIIAEENIEATYVFNWVYEEEVETTTEAEEETTGSDADDATTDDETTDAEDETTTEEDATAEDETAEDETTEDATEDTTTEDATEDTDDETATETEDVTVTQTVEISLDPTCISLYDVDEEGNELEDATYPASSDAIGDVTTDYENVTVSNEYTQYSADEDADKTTITNISSVTNDGTVTLQWYCKHESDVNKNGWYFVVTVTAPDDADGAQYEIGDSDVYSNDTLYIFVESEESVIDTTYKFDWNGDGVYEQFVVISIDSVEFDYTNYNALDLESPKITVTKDNTVYTNEDVTVTFTAQDKGTQCEIDGCETYTSGIASVTYTNEDGTVKDQLTVTEDGEYEITVSDTCDKITVTVTDNNGNSTSETIKISADKVAPTFNGDEEYSTEEWTNEDVTITGTLSDNLSGIKDIEITETKAEDAEITFDISDDGLSAEYTLIIPAQTFEGDIEVTCYDNAGNSSTITFSVRMDTTDCEIISRTVDPEEWTNGDVTISGTVYDANSGVDSVKAESDAEAVQVEYSQIENEDADATGTTFSYTVTVPAQNYEGTVTVYFTDVAGNTTSETVNVYLDNTAPVVETAEADPDSWTNEDVVISGTVSDNLSGVVGVYYAKGEVTQEITQENITELTAVDASTDSTYSFTITATDYEGIYTVYCIDEAGNVSEAVTVDVYMDTTAPANLAITFEDSTLTKDLSTVLQDVFETVLEAITFGFYNSTTTVTLSADDTEGGAHSGISYFEYTVTKISDTEDEEPEIYASGTWTDEDYSDAETDTAEVEIDIPDEGYYVVTFTVYDKAGNSSETESAHNEYIQGAAVDLTDPVVSVNYSGTPVNSIENYDEDGTTRYYYDEVQTVTITVTDENFDASADYELIDATLTATDVNGDSVDGTVTDADGNVIDDLETYLSNNDVWVKTEVSDDQDYFVATIYLLGDANYTLSIQVGDLATNASNIVTDYITVDLTAPVVTIEYSDPITVKILKAITFGLYDGEDAESVVTITATDTTTPIEAFTYSALNYDGVSDVNDFEIAETTITRTGDYEQDNEDVKVTTSNNNGTVEVKFTLDPQFRGNVSAVANDTALNECDEVVTGDTSEGDTLDGAIVDNIAPEVVSVEVSEPLLVVDDADNEVTVDTGALETLGLETNEYYYGDTVTVTISINEANFDMQADADGTTVVPPEDTLIEVKDSNGNAVDTAQSEWTNTADDVYSITITFGDSTGNTDERYTVTVSCTDESGNEMTYTSADIIIDSYAPSVTDFDFSTTGEYYVVDTEEGTLTDQESSTTDEVEYDYYFEEDFKVTVNATDAVVADYDDVAGVTDIILIAYDIDLGKWVSVSEGTLTEKNDVYSKTFTISGPFKGSLYAIAVDRLGYYPSSTSTLWNTEETYYEFIYGETTTYSTAGIASTLTAAGLETGAEFVAPYESISEDSAKHTEESDITITINDSTDNTELKKDYSPDYDWLDGQISNIKDVDSDATRDSSVDFVKKNATVPLYDSNVSVTITVTDEYAGIRQIDWYIYCQEDPDNTTDGVYKQGTISISNSAKVTQASKDDDGNTLNKLSSVSKDETDENLVTELSGNVNISCESNDIIILVVLTDRAGNKSYDYNIIGIDKSDPIVTVELDSEDETGNYSTYYNTTKTLTVTVTDRNFDASRVEAVVENTDSDYTYTPSISNITKLSAWSCEVNYGTNGIVKTKTYTYKISFTKDGTFTFTIKATDGAGNYSSEKSKATQSAFTIDKTDPVIKVSLDQNSIVQNEFYFNETRTATITVTEHNFNKNDFENLIEATLNGSSITVPSVSSFTSNGDTHTATVTFSDDGDYVLAFAYTDMAGNYVETTTSDFSGTAAYDFTIDKTAPEIVISATDGYAYSSGPVVTVTEIDNNCSTVTSTLTGVVWDSENSTTKTTNISSSTQTQTADHYSDDFVVTYSVIEQDGYYTVTASCVDMAGNESGEFTKNFTVNENGSCFVVSDDLNTLNGGYANSDTVNGYDLYVLEYSAVALEDDYEAYIVIGSAEQSGYITRELYEHEDGGWYVYIYEIDAGAISYEGNYSVYIRSYSVASDNTEIINNDTKTDDDYSVDISFTIDNTAPTVRISGLEKHSYYGQTTQDVTLTVVENHLSKIKVTVEEESKTTVYVWVSDADEYDKSADDADEVVVEEFDEDSSNIVVSFTIESSDVTIEVSDLANNYAYGGNDDGDFVNLEELFADSSDRDDYISYESNALVLKGITLTDNWVEYLGALIDENTTEAIAIIVAAVVVIALAILIPVLVKKRKKADAEDAAKLAE